MLRGKKDQEEGGKKRSKTEGARPDPTRPTCIESKPDFFHFTQFDSSLFRFRFRYMTQTFHNALL